MVQSNWSRHAQRRMRQRGVRTFLVETLLRWADHEKPIGRGCVALSFRPRRLAELRSEGLLPKEIERLARHVVITAGDGTVVTVGKLYGGHRGRLYRHGAR